jgi:hypothetical protein
MLRMPKLSIAVASSVAALILLSATTAVRASTRGERFVSDSEKNLDELIVKLPSLADIKRVVADDCKAKTNRPDADAFCACGAAITISLWRADDTMRGRLTTYIANPSPTSASEFVKYEGPELYGPACAEALGSR